ncbi:MAG: hypothetical protein Q7T74_07665, partial [Candidatus Saccharibacteria bacterium]|nr:hypothetical protein [Candidatus Saccharibacteria bacterium]
MNKILTKSKITLTSLLLASTLAFPFNSVFAIEAPTPPTAPTAPSAPVVDVQNVPLNSSDSTPQSGSESVNSGNGAGSNNNSSTSTTNDTEITNVNDANVTNDQNVDVSTGGNEANKNGGDASVTSGNAGVSGGLMTDINNNTITIGDLCGQGCSEGFVAANLKNGNGTLNNADGSLTNLVIINNSNNLNLTNNSNLGASTGYNSASKNMGSGTIVSGDADVVFTTINFGNNNGINATTADYNIVDNQSSDLWIQFPTGVASGSGLGNLGAINSGNGADSNNSASTSSNSSTLIDNNNNLVLTNDVNLYANTGNNSSDKNMGSGNITTGDANIASNVINFLNNNIVAGAQWLLSTVNIFGNMTGNIILPRDSGLSGCSGCAVDLSGGNIGNGAGSDNSANTSADNTTVINQVNDATVGNNLNIDANTGGNSVDKNMGDSSISTGNTSVSSNLVTVANTNAVGQGDTWWLVIVNNHGTYTGQIVGANDNMIAGSGLQFGVSPNGTVYALNSGNGADSTNNANTSSENSTTINNTNNATINNNINIDANTGNNTADKNMGGADIQTGDVNVVSNIVNFINNNFVGTKFVVTFVNIFGSFSGKIITPDQDLPDAAGIGGPTNVDLGPSTTSSGKEIKSTKVKTLTAQTGSV